MSLEQLTHILCHPVLNLHGPASAGSGTLLSPLPPGHTHASARMEWIAGQRVWGELSSEAQTLVRRTVELLESVPPAAAATATAAMQGHTATSPTPPSATATLSPTQNEGESREGGSQSAPPVTSSLGASPAGSPPATCKTPAPGGPEFHSPSGVSGSVSPSGSSVSSISGAPPAGSVSASLSRASSEPPAPSPVRSVSDSTPAASAPVPSRLPSLSHVDWSEDSLDAYDAHAAVLSPMSAPHGDALSRFGRHASLQRQPSASATPTPPLINDVTTSTPKPA